MRCLANVFLKQKAKCILRNVDILVSKELKPYPKDIECFEICVDKFYEYFIFGRRDITNTLNEYEDIFNKYDVDNIVIKRMLLLIFENVVDYLDIINNPVEFEWYYLVAKMMLLCIMLEELTNSLTVPKVDYYTAIKLLEKKNSYLFDDESKKLFNDNYLKIIKNITKSVSSSKKCLNMLSKSPLKVYYDYMGNIDGYNLFISKVNFDKKYFEGIDESHAFDAFVKYGFALDFKYIEAEHISFEVIKNVFDNKPNTLYFVKLPNDFFKLKTNITKMYNIVEPKTIRNFVFLVPYKEFMNRDVKVKELKNYGFKLGVYDFNTVEIKSLKLKNVIDYVYFKHNKVSNYNSIVEFSHNIGATIIENDGNTYKVYK